MILEGSILVFDMDGTLIHSKSMLTKSIQFAVSKFGIVVENPDTLTHLLGPPLFYSMQDHFKLSESDAQKAVDLFHDHYESTGMRNEDPFIGIVETLMTLKNKGFLMGVATAAPQEFAEQILAHHRLDVFFDAIAGSAPDRRDKALILSHCLSHIQLDDQQKSQTVFMIGDRDRDILAAKQLGHQSIAAAYGYASPGEIEAAEPDDVIQSPKDLLNLLGSGQSLSDTNE